MTPAPSSLHRAGPPTSSPTGVQSGTVTYQQPQGRPSGGVHQSGQSAPYSLNEILALLGVAGYKGQQQANMAAIAMAESGGDPNAIHTNADGSHDRGLFQINDKTHPDVSDACAFDPVCSAHKAAAIEKGSGWGAWSTWPSPANTFLPEAEAAQKAGKWKRFQSEFTGDKLGQANQPPSAGAAAPQSSGMLFDCRGGSISTFGPIVTGGSLPDIGCYLESSFIFAMYAVGGLLLIGAGVLMLMHKNPIAVGLKGTMLGAGAASSAGRRALASRLPEEEPVVKPPTRAQALAEQREARIAARQAQFDPIAASRAKAETSAMRAKTAVTREEARAMAQRRKQGALAGMMGPTKTVTILGQDVEIPSFETEGIDPTRMRG